MATYPSIHLDGHPCTILTNQGCESTGYWTPDQFESLGLDYGEQDGEPYPLTDEEAGYISYQNTITPIGGDLMFGYSALWQGYKWATPCIEYPLDVREHIEAERMSIELLIRNLFPTPSHVVYDNQGPEDRITLMILVKFSDLTSAFNGAHDWKRYLESGMSRQDQRQKGQEA